MKYTVQSGKYAIKNFIYLFPFVILPAIFLAFSTDEQAIFSVIYSLVKGNIHDWSFSEIFRAISILNFGSWEAIVFGVGGIILIVPCVALFMAFLEKHMRIGKRTYNGLWAKLNDNFISTFFGVVVLLVLYEVWAILISAFLFLFSRITVAAVAITLCAIVYILFHILLTVGISAIYLWLPCMQITGFRTVEALQYSYQLSGEVKLKIIVPQLLTLWGVELLIGVCAVFLPSFWLIKGIISVLYAGVFMIFCVRMQITYFDRDHIERADKKKKYYQR